MDPQKPISISAELYNLIVQRIKNSEGEFNTVEEYVNFVLITFYIYTTAIVP